MVEFRMREPAVPGLVSVLIISYNQQEFIGEAIRSCLAQTFANLEVVVADDGSTDSTPDIIRRFAMQDDRVRPVLNQVNKGITANSNSGLAVTRGEYLGFMGGDDVLAPTKLGMQVAAFERSPELTLSYHPCYIIGANTEGSRVVGDRKKDDVRNLIDMVAKFGAEMSGPATMFRRSAVPAWGFDADIATASDWLFFIDVSSQGRVERLNEPLGYYRRHPGSVANVYSSYADDFLLTIDKVRDRYGDVPGISGAADAGERRFLVGALYRAVEAGNRDQVRHLSKQLARRWRGPVPRSIRALAHLPGAARLAGSARRALKTLF